FGPPDGLWRLGPATVETRCARAPSTPRAPSSAGATAKAVPVKVSAPTRVKAVAMGSRNVRARRDACAEAVRGAGEGNNDTGTEPGAFGFGATATVPPGRCNVNRARNSRTFSYRSRARREAQSRTVL